MNRANKSGVVVYTVDPRGLATTGLTAEDDGQIPMDDAGDPKGSKQRDRILNALKTRHDFLQNSQEALRYMAEQTGGLTIQNTNDLSAGLGRVLNDLRGYYLIGYEARPGGADWENAPSASTSSGVTCRFAHGRVRSGPRCDPRTTPPSSAIRSWPPPCHPSVRAACQSTSTRGSRAVRAPAISCARTCFSRAAICR